MPNIHDMKASKFLKKEDVGRGVLVTIQEIRQINVAQEGAPEELKWCATFKEEEKPLVLNSTNNALIASIVGSEETDDWGGHQVVLYNDPTVMFKSEIKGGIRIRAPKGTAAAKKDDDLPF